jgi:bacterioferritin (cytochrome b1)
MMLNRILSNAAFARKRQFLHSQMLQGDSLSKFGELNTVKEP